MHDDFSLLMAATAITLGVVAILFRRCTALAADIEVLRREIRAEAHRTDLIREDLEQHARFTLAHVKRLSRQAEGVLVPSRN